MGTARILAWPLAEGADFSGTKREDNTYRSTRKAQNGVWVNFTDLIEALDRSNALLLLKKIKLDRSKFFVGQKISM